MAEIRDELVLDIDRALRAINDLERALDRSLGAVEIRIDLAQAQGQLDQLAQAADRALGDVDVDIDSAGAARLNDELANAERNLAQADVEADQLTGSLRQAERAAADVDSRFGSIRQTAGNLVGVIGAAAGITAAVRLAGAARTAFADLQDSVNAVKVVFGEASGGVLEFSDTVAQTAGLSMAQFNQAASVLGSSLINVGFGFDEAAGKTIELTQRAADMASIFGGEVSVAVDAILSALRGESNPIERFGVTLTEAKVQAEAAALGFREINGEFDSTAKAAARLNIIMRETDRTAGDFANTSGDLANAQKIAAAEFENARAELGEALLPVFQALLDAAPEVLQAVEDLAPALSSLATGAGNLATSTPGVIDFVDALHLLSDLPRGFGQLGDLLNAGLGFVTADFDKVDRALQNTLERLNTQGLIDDLREGGDAATTLANRLAEVGKKGKLDPRFITDLGKIAGVDLETNVAVLVNLITNAERLGLAADDVDALRIALALLSDQGAPSGPIRSLSDRIRELPEATAEAAVGLSTIRSAAEEAGVGMDEFVLSTDPAIQAMLDALPPSVELGLKLDALGSSVSVAAEFLADTLRPALVDAGDALTDLNDDGRVTASEFITNLAAMTAATLEFKANLATIAAISPELAASLQALPEDVAAGILEGFAADPAKILAAEQALLGTPQQISATIRDVVGAAMSLAASNPSAEQVAKFTALVTTLDIPGATAAITPVLQGVLDVSFADLQPPDLTDQVVTSIQGWSSVEIAAAVEQALTANVVVDFGPQGVEAGSTFMFGMQEAIAARSDSLRTTITGTLDTAIERQSPPKLFLDAGKDSGEAFWSGFEQANLTLRTPAPGITGTINPGTTGGVSGGVHIELTTVNPIQQDQVSDVARMAQQASSIANSYRSVVPNGM